VPQSRRNSALLKANDALKTPQVAPIHTELAQVAPYCSVILL